MSVGVSSYVIKKGEQTFLELLPATVSLLLDKAKRGEISSSLQDDFATNEVFYQTPANFFPVGILVHADGKIIYVNPTGVKLLRAGSAEEIIGKASEEIIAYDQRKLSLDRVEHIELTGVPAAPAEFKFLRMGGSLVDVETIATMITFKGQRARLVIAQDISDRKRSKVILHGTIKSIPDGIAYYDAVDRLA